MAPNIEIKARIESVSALMLKVSKLASEGPFEIDQDDTFFYCPNGRLKLRTFSQKSGELIFYRRSDQTGPKKTFYMISQTSSPDILQDLLTLAYGQAGRVRKKRTVYMVGRTRVHLDRVQGLGDFLELEVPLSDSESNETGMAEAYCLMAPLGISTSQFIEGAYLDLLATPG
ncbi:MAG: class IV adenylate cyclase [Deltaproteobacteria bacterium]|nr:class IV adenylate cyclase [Deltaproteobacteria bacterium]